MRGQQHVADPAVRWSAAQGWANTPEVGCRCLRLAGLGVWPRWGRAHPPAFLPLGAGGAKYRPVGGAKGLPSRACACAHSWPTSLEPLSRFGPTLAPAAPVSAKIGQPRARFSPRRPTVGRTRSDLGKHGLTGDAPGPESYPEPDVLRSYPKVATTLSTRCPRGRDLAKSWWSIGPNWPQARGRHMSGAGSERWKSGANVKFRAADLPEIGLTPTRVAPNAVERSRSRLSRFGESRHTGLPAIGAGEVKHRPTPHPGRRQNVVSREHPRRNRRPSPKFGPSSVTPASLFVRTNKGVHEKTRPWR